MGEFVFGVTRGFSSVVRGSVGCGLGVSNAIDEVDELSDGEDVGLTVFLLSFDTIVIGFL